MPPETGPQPGATIVAPAELWTAAMAAAADRHTMDTLGTPSPVLMERAALSVSAEIERWLAGARVPIVALCGPGNNGGDGLAVARQLHGRGHEVRAIMIVDRHNDAVAQQLALARAHGVRVAQGVDALPDERVLFVDALLGTGSKGAPRGAIEDALVRLGERSDRVVAVDLPSGVDPDTGAIPGAVVRSDLTVTFQRSKPGLHLTPARAVVGRVVVAEIGLVASPEPGPSLSLIGPHEVATALRGLAPGRHKGERGHVGLLAGAGGTPGAGIIAGTAALRAGAGLVTLASDDPDLTAKLLRDRPELMVEPREASSLLPRADALVVGPGLTSDASRRGLAALYTDDPRPAIWDASGLEELPPGSTPAGPRVVTPHPGEAARLLTRLGGDAWDGARVQENRLAAARELARLTNAVAVLKGEGTVVARADQDVAICVTGGTALATAGSGDALSGVIGALLGRGLDAWTAARVGVHVHGLAGELAQQRRPGVLAMDVADAMGEAMTTAGEGNPPPGWPRLRLG